MEEFWDRIAPALLRSGLLVTVALGVILLTVHMIKRPTLHRHHPARRLMPRVVAVLAVMVVLAGALIALVGMGTSDDPANGREMMIMGTGTCLLAVFLLWGYVIMYVEAGPESLSRRGLLGRTRTIRYADVIHIDDHAVSGTRTIVVRSRDGTKISTSIGMLDWTPFLAWQERQDSPSPR